MNVFVNIPLDQNQQARLVRKFPEHHFDFSDTSGQSFLAEGPHDPRLMQADVAFGQPPVAQIPQARHLRLVQLSTAGYERYAHPEFLTSLEAKGIALCTASAVFDRACAEHALAMMLAQCRLLPVAISASPSSQPKLAGHWPSGAMRRGSRLLHSSEVAIVGYGAIGAVLARLLQPFTSRITAFRRRPRGDELVTTLPYGSLDAELPKFDHVVNILPGGPDTIAFFNAARFAAMKPAASFFNIGRGTTVDQTALAAALRLGLIASAWLDVTDPEPLPPEHDLWSTPNCHITPHTAGGFSEEREAQVDHFIEQLERFSLGEPLRCRIV